MRRVTRATSALSSAPSEIPSENSFEPLPKKTPTPKVQWSIEQRDALFAIVRGKADQEL